MSIVDGAAEMEIEHPPSLLKRHHQPSPDRTSEFHPLPPLVTATASLSSPQRKRFCTPDDLCQDASRIHISPRLRQVSYNFDSFPVSFLAGQPLRCRQRENSPPKVCVRCLAGESGHILHILEELRPPTAGGYCLRKSHI